MPQTERKAPMTPELRVGVYPGTFDPITIGHFDLIVRALRVVDRLVVAVAQNREKGPMFGLDERVDMVREEVASLPPELASRIEVKPFDSLLMQFVTACGANVIIRGLRAVSDFEYEFQMASMNHKLNSEVETVFLTASESHQFIASRFVKEISRLGGDVSHFVSPRVVRRLRNCWGLSVDDEPGPKPADPQPLARSA